MFRDGQRVAYVGELTDGRHTIGDEAEVVGAGNTASWVRWTTGSLTGSMEEIGHLDLTPTDIDHSIDAMSKLVTIPVREVVARRGVVGVINRLNVDGYLSGFDTIAEEALSLIASRIRTDPAIAEVLGQLDDEDGEELVSTATVALLRDAFGGE